MSELRGGLAKHLYGVIPFGDCTRNDAEALADSVLAYLHAHDGHAEFVRAVREIAENAPDMNPALLQLSMNNLADLCDAELAKEQSNG